MTPNDQTRWIRWLPQRGAITSLYLPVAELPPGETEAVAFNFAVGALATGSQNYGFHRPFLLYAITAHDDHAAGFMLQIWHQLEKSQRRLFARHVNGAAAAGTGALPLMLPYPYLLDTGDTVTIEAKNLDRSGAISNIQVALFGVALEDLPPEAFAA